MEDSKKPPSHFRRGTALLLLTAAGLASYGPVGATEAGAPYDFQGIRLGMTMTEFKAAPLPELPNHPDSAGEKKALCTGEGNQLFLKPDGTDAKLGVSRCAWAGSRNTVYPAWLAVTDCGTHWYSLDFISKEGDSAAPSEARLFRMQFEVHVRCYDAVITGLIQKFGKANSAEPSAVQNRMGATFDNETRIWTNKVSSIVAIKRASNVDRLLLLYTLEDHAKVYEARRTQMNGGKAPNL